MYADAWPTISRKMRSALAGRPLLLFRLKRREDIAAYRLGQQGRKLFRGTASGYGVYVSVMSWDGYPRHYAACGLSRLGFVGETSPSHEKTPVIPSFREKTSGIRQKKALTAPIRDASAHTPAIIHNEEASLCWDPLPCNSTALAPQGFHLTFVAYLLRSTLPMAVFRPHSFRCFGRILALTVPSAGGSSPHSFKTAA